MSTTTREMNPALQREFGERMGVVLNDAAIALMASIGHRTGLFDTMASLPPRTSREIAGAAGLNERYVREWLAAMVTGRIVDYDPSSATYRLPPEHAAWLTRAARADNFARTFQNIPLLATVEDPILSCFRSGGGVPYAAFARFHDIMAEESDETTAAMLLTSILPVAPGISAELERGIEVLDVGCGRGRALNVMARAFPRSRFTGIEISESAVAAGRAESEELGLRNVRFEAKDVAELDDSARFGLITAFDAIHDQAQPRRVLGGVARALAPRGVFLMQDIAGSSQLEKNLDHPLAPFLYTVSCMHCMTVSLARHGEGLGTMWGEERAKGMLSEAGFTRVEVSRLPHDVMNLYYVCTRD